MIRTEKARQDEDGYMSIPRSDRENLKLGLSKILILKLYRETRNVVSQTNKAYTNFHGHTTLNFDSRPKL